LSLKLVLLPPVSSIQRLTSLLKTPCPVKCLFLPYITKPPVNLWAQTSAIGKTDDYPKDFHPYPAERSEDPVLLVSVIVLKHTQILTDRVSPYNSQTLSRRRRDIASSLILVPALRRDSEGFCLLNSYIYAVGISDKKIRSNTISLLLPGRVVRNL